jgi:hypothetical protein
MVAAELTTDFDTEEQSNRHAAQLHAGQVAAGGRSS